MPNAPTTLCRQDLAFALLKRTGGDPNPRRFLEIGTGEGEFLHLLALRGYRGLSIDVSEPAVAHAMASLGERGVEGVEVRRDDLFEIAGSYPLVFAFEVLEHIENDTGAVERIASLLEPGGRFLFSVPAHMKHWGPTDEIVGHVRRYEREELCQKLGAAGLEAEELWSVAVPVGNVLLAVRTILNRLRISKNQVAETMQERTEGSGLDRVVAAPDAVYGALFNRYTMAPLCVLQRAFVNGDAGTGFIGVARAPR